MDLKIHKEDLCILLYDEVNKYLYKPQSEYMSLDYSGRLKIDMEQLQSNVRNAMHGVIDKLIENIYTNDDLEKDLKLK